MSITIPSDLSPYLSKMNLKRSSINEEDQGPITKARTLVLYMKKLERSEPNNPSTTSVQKSEGKGQPLDETKSLELAQGRML